jgi:phosphotransferase system enzyme I (PtsI)
VSDSPSELVLKGIPASTGIAHGTAFILMEGELEVNSYRITEDEIAKEIERFEKALVVTRKEIGEIRNRILNTLGDKEAQIFEAHQMVLEDRALIEETLELVAREKRNVEFCFQHVAQRYIDFFDSVDDEYLRERVNDIRDVTRRVIHNLMGIKGQRKSRLEDLDGRKIIVAKEFNPSDTAVLDHHHILGLLSDTGGRTSHAIIMARSIDVPAVVGLHDATAQIKEGDTLLVDGYEGLVYINPSRATLHRYGRLQDERNRMRKVFESAAALEPVTLDGHTVTLKANIEGSDDVDAVRQRGASGVGLYRTEALFLAQNRLPTEEEQFEEYRRVVGGLAPLPVTLRTLDLGGDKTLPRESFSGNEMNPNMGFRAIRFCLKYPEIFKDQLRAILRASAFGKARIMFPMISGVTELRESIRYLEEAKSELDAVGRAYDRNIEVGIMVEVPSAALVAEHLADYCSFFSIGTNDLIQYTLAVDRVNDHIAHLYEPGHPSVVRLIRRVIEVAKARGKTVSVCGEMAGDVVYAPLLIGLGADELSISPRLLPEIKFLIRRMNQAEAAKVAEEILLLPTSRQIFAAAKSYYLSVMRELLNKEGASLNEDA